MYQPEVRTRTEAAEAGEGMPWWRKLAGRHDAHRVITAPCEDSRRRNESPAPAHLRFDRLKLLLKHTTSPGVRFNIFITCSTARTERSRARASGRERDSTVGTREGAGGTQTQPSRCFTRSSSSGNHRDNPKPRSTARLKQTRRDFRERRRSEMGSGPLHPHSRPCSRRRG